MAESALAKKIKLRPGSRALTLNAPQGYRRELEPLPEGVELAEQLRGKLVFAPARRPEVGQPGLGQPDLVGLCAADLRARRGQAGAALGGQIGPLAARLESCHGGCRRLARGRASATIHATKRRVSGSLTTAEPPDAKKQGLVGSSHAGFGARPRKH